MGAHFMLTLLALTFSTVNCQISKCDAPADVVFLLDGSLSIESEDWNYVKTFVEMLVDSFDIQPYAVHAGAVVFSRFIGDIISLNPYKDKETIKRMVRNLTQPRDDTNTALGIKSLRMMLRSQGRPNKPHFGIVVTDGKSSLPAETKQEALLAKQDGITMIAVGVARLFITEVNDIASEGHAFSVKDFRSLPNLVYFIRDMICSERSTTVMTTTTTASTTTVTLIPPPDIACDMPADIVFLLDASHSIEDHNWIKQKHFVATLINSLHIHPETIHVGIVVFSTFIGDVVPLMPFKDKRTLVQLTKTLKQPGFGTNTNKGIAKVREMMTSQGRRSEGVPQIAIVITDGQSDYTDKTQAQAKAAKDEGIIMIAVGISSHAMTDELINIASSRRKVFPVADFNALFGLVNVMKDLICTAITTTITPPPLTTTPAPNIPQLCSGCKIDNGIGYNPYPGDCSKYIQCYRDEMRFRALIKRCPFGLFWDRESVTCRPAEEVDCAADKCLNSTENQIHPYRGYGCRSYLICQESHSVPMCCPQGSRFVYQMGCIQDSSCRDDCPPVSTENLKNTCLLKAHKDKRKFVQSIPGHGSMVRPCAPGTVFSYPHCSCIKDTDTSSNGPCLPTVHYTFDQNTKDSSGNNIEAVAEGVKIIGHGVGHFDGTSKMTIPSFSGTDFGQKLTIRLRYKMDGTGVGDNGGGQTMWMIIGANGQVTRSGYGQIPIDIFRALQQGTITGTLARQIVSTVDGTTIWQIIGLDGSVLHSGFGPITGQTMMQIANFKPNGNVLLKWYIYANDGTVITSGEGDIPLDIQEQLQHGIIRGFIVKEVLGYNGVPKKWMVLDRYGNVKLTGTGHVPQDVITHLRYREEGLSTNVNHTLWFVVDLQGRIIQTGTGEVPKSVIEGIRDGRIHGSLGREIVSPQGTVWQILGLDGNVLQTGSGQTDQTVLKLIANFGPGDGTNEVWYLYTTDGKLSKSGNGKIPKQILQELQRETLKGILVTRVLPSNGGSGKWNIIGSDGKIVKSGSGILTRDVILQYITSVKHPNGGLVWFIIGPGGNAIKSGFGNPPASVLRHLAEGKIKGSLVRQRVDSQGREGKWEIINSFGQVVHTGRGSIPTDVLKQLQNQFSYESNIKIHNKTQVGIQWKVIMSDGTVHTGVGSIPRYIVKSVEKERVTWTIKTPDGRTRTGTGKFPLDLVKTNPETGGKYSEYLKEWYMIKNGKIVQSGFGDSVPSDENVGYRTSWTVLKQIGFNGQTSGWKLVDPDGVVRDQGSGVVPSDIFYRIQFLIDPQSVTTTTPKTTSQTIIKTKHVPHSGPNLEKWLIINADGSHGKSGTGRAPAIVVEAIRSGKSKGAIIMKMTIGGTIRWQIISSGGKVQTGSGAIPTDVMARALRGTTRINDRPIQPKKITRQKVWRITHSDGTVETGTGNIPARVLNRVTQWVVTLSDGTTQTGSGSLPRHLIDDSAPDIRPFVKPPETVTKKPVMTFWRIVLSNGKVHTGIEEIPEQFLNNVREWMIMTPRGFKKSGTGNIPAHILKLTNGVKRKTGKTNASQFGSLIGGVVQKSVMSPGSWSIALQDGSVRSGSGSIPQDVLQKVRGQRVRWAITLPDHSVKSGKGSIPQNILQQINTKPGQLSQGKPVRGSSSVPGVHNAKIQKQWTITLPDGSSRTGTGPIPTDVLQKIQGASTRWTVLSPDGKPIRGVGEIPPELLDGSAFSANTARNRNDGAGAESGKIFSRWSFVLEDGRVKTGTGTIPADILSKLTTNSQWTVVDSKGQVRTGSGFPPGLHKIKVKTQTQPGFGAGNTGGGGAEGRIFGGSKVKIQRVIPGSVQVNRTYIGPLQYDLIPIRGTSRRLRRQVKWNSKMRSLWQHGQHQTLVANCDGKMKRGASIMILANDQEIIFSLKTRNTAKAVILSMAAKHGFNDIELQYDGNYLTGVVNGAKRSVPLSGDIEKRQAALTIASCDGFSNFHGDLDEFALYKCNP